MDCGDPYPDMSIPGTHGLNRRAYRLYRCVSSIRVVFSMDFTTTLILGVKGAAAASLKGLKLKRVETMRLDVFGRWRTRIDKVFRVASTSKGSLRMQQKTVSHVLCCYLARRTNSSYLLSFSRALSILSNNPEASASS